MVNVINNEKAPPYFGIDSRFVDLSRFVKYDFH